MILVWAACTLAFAEDAPKTMTKLTVKLESPEIPKDSFAAQPKRLYRAGARYCRTEENPDLENGIHGLLIINEPDSWLVNLMDKTGKHILDPGPTYNCRMPIFTNGEDIKSAEDLKLPLMDLEFGRELEFFRPRSGAPKAGPVLRSKATMVYSVQAGNSELLLFTGGEPEAPVAVIRQKDKVREILWYGEFEEIPFDAKMFAKPEGIAIQERSRNSRRPSVDWRWHVFRPSSLGVCGRSEVAWRKIAVFSGRAEDEDTLNNKAYAAVSTGI